MVAADAAVRLPATAERGADAAGARHAAPPAARLLRRPGRVRGRGALAAPHACVRHRLTQTSSRDFSITTGKVPFY